MKPAPLLTVDNLQVAFRLHDADGRSRRVEAVGRGDQGISFDVPPNTTVALVGESGSGKSVTAMALVQLLPRNAECAGRVLWRGDDLLQAPRAHMQRLRGHEIACVFQDPMSSLNPVLTVGAQIAEPLRKHLGLGRAAARKRAEELLAEVGIPEPRRRLDTYPHQLSGGQQQRVMIAMALACEPQLLIADEPTTALDVTIQRQILELLARLQAQRGLSMLFISHDLGVVGEIAQQVVVMRQGTVRESGSVRDIFTAPQDAYTKALLACRPRLDERPRRLMAIADVLEGDAVDVDLPLAPRPTAAEHGPRRADDDDPVVLQVDGLSKSFWLRSGLFGRTEFKAVQDVRFTLRRGHTLGVVGESGSGKTTMGLALLRLHDATSGPLAGR
ncbi:MAG: ATP-binding cassette domain-containing protein, partial [Betaproteobacteria bacterium]